MQIIGKGGFGREVSEYCEFNNIPTFQYENECTGMQYKRDAVIAIGDEEVRERIVGMFPLQSWGTLNFGTTYGICVIEKGTIICPATILTTNVTIGRHCVININCTIGHDAFIGDFVTISPGVNISGNVSIGANCNIGSNSVIREGITICDDVIIGAGSVVVKDITEPGTYVGNPAVRLDKRPKYVTQKDNIYLRLIKDVEDLNKFSNSFVKATETVNIRLRQLTPQPKSEKVEKK